MESGRDWHGEAKGDDLAWTGKPGSVRCAKAMSFAALNPSYALRARGYDRA